MATHFEIPVRFRVAERKELQGNCDPNKGRKKNCRRNVKLITIIVLMIIYAPSLETKVRVGFGTSNNKQQQATTNSNKNKNMNKNKNKNKFIQQNIA